MIGRACRRPDRPLSVWLLRGCTGFALLALALLTREPLIAVPAVLVALILFRGCPACWLLELADRGLRTAHSLPSKEKP
jgi:hypothetical protein